MRSLSLALCLCALLLPADRVGAATIVVNQYDDLQAAFNAARPGDTILLQAGAAFTGNFVLPAKGGSSYITVRSAAPDSSLPAAGTRITPAYAGVMPKILSDRPTRRGRAPSRRSVSKSPVAGSSPRG